MIRELPLISVIITSYNYLHYITEAIDSARAQTYPNVEVVVVDNCSTDGTFPALTERYRDDPRVRLYQNERNIGERENAKRGYALTKGEYILWLSADDWLLPRHIELLAAVFERNLHIDVVHSGAFIADAAGRVWTMRQLPGQLPFDYVDARDELVDMLVTNCPLCWPAALFPRSLFAEISLDELDPEITASDWEIQIMIALAGKRFAYVSEPSMVLRNHDQQNTAGDYIASGRNTMDFLRILKKFVDLPQTVERMRGRELGIVTLLRDFVRYTNQFSGRNVFTADDQSRIDAMCAHLERRAATIVPAQVVSRLISIILPTPQAPQAARRAIESVAQQTHQNWELIIVDDGPMPFGEWFRAHPLWERMSYVRSPAPHLPSRARNFGLRLARGEYLAFLDEENVYQPHHLATLVDAIARSGTHAAASGVRCVLEHWRGQLIDFETLGAVLIHRTPDDPAEIGQIAAATPVDAVLLHRAVIDRIGRFNEQLPILDDFDFLIRLERNTPIAYSSAVTLDVRMRVEMNNALGARIAQYIDSLDTVYANHPVSAELQSKRAIHRRAVQAAIASVFGKAVHWNDIARLVATLAGRTPGIAGPGTA